MGGYSFFCKYFLISILQYQEWYLSVHFSLECNHLKMSKSKSHHPVGNYLPVISNLLRAGVNLCSQSQLLTSGLINTDQCQILLNILLPAYQVLSMARPVIFVLTAKHHVTGASAARWFILIFLSKVREELISYPLTEDSVLSTEKN